MDNDWLHKQSWLLEDGKYAPKRRVNNKGSYRRPHIIGSFFSRKMGRVVEYESLNEYLFYALLELDVVTVRYYVQPVEVAIPSLDRFGRLYQWNHVPDVLVFRQESAPHLYQVKDISELPDEKTRVNVCCTQYAEDREWKYSVVRPRTIPTQVAQNAKLLMGFLKPRMGFESLIPQVIERMRFKGSTTIDELSRGFQGQAHPLLVLPVIYHLITIGVLEIKVHEPVNEFSTIRLFSREAGKNLSWGDTF